MSAGSAERGSAVAQPPKPVVMKFGGTSVDGAVAIRRVAQLVKHRLRAHPVVVVSAFAGVTDELLEAGRAAAKGELPRALEVVQRLERRHDQVVADLLLGPDQRRCLWERLASDFANIKSLSSQVSSAALLSPRLQDHLLGIGESLSSKIVSAALVQAGLDAAWVDACACIVTDAAHTRATPLWDESDAQIQALLPLLSDDQVPVLGGFLGATRDGIPTTLGRGGSDFSASIIGAALQAIRIEIWTDVDGILTTDPKLCPEAQRVPTMSFEEAADLAYFGAKVLHPSTIAPAMRKNIPVLVLNSRNPEGRGTEIVARPEDSGCTVKAVTVKKGIAVVDVEAVRWLAPELLREIFEIFERHQHSLDLLSASRGSLSLLVNSTAALPAIADELRGMANVRWENHKALVCLVGERVRRQPEIASQVFRALSTVDLRMICQGASERNISFLVDEGSADDAVRRLHRLFFPVALDSASPEAVAYPMCQAGGSWQ